MNSIRRYFLASPAEIVSDQRKWDIIAECKVMDEGQSGDEAGCGAFGETSPFCIGETAGGRRVRQVNAKREDVWEMLIIKLIDTWPVGIDGHDTYSGFGEYFGEPAVVAAQVEGIGEFGSVEGTGGRVVAFASRYPLTKDGLIVVVTPRGRVSWGRVHAADDGLQMFDEPVLVSLEKRRFRSAAAGWRELIWF